MVKITADSTCDLSREITAELGVDIIPLHVLIDGIDYRDGVDISSDDIFRLVDTEGKTCSTSAANIHEYETFFSQFADKHDAIVHICIGSNLSSSFQNASMAAMGFKNVFIVDSANLSSGSGHLVYDAALLAKDGLDAQGIVDALEKTKPMVDASFVIERMDYLHKGGRCSGIELFGANLLKIKPCIEVRDGKMGVGKKYRGNFDRCLEHYVEDRLEDIASIDTERIFITHPACPPEIVEGVKESIRKRADFRQVIETRAGCTISSHCGPYTLGILFKRKA